MSEEFNTGSIKVKDIRTGDMICEDMLGKPVHYGDKVIFYTQKGFAITITESGIRQMLSAWYHLELNEVKDGKAD